MEIRSLRATPLDRIVACLNQAFAGYFVPLPTSVAYWEQRFSATGVDFGYSYGVFAKEELVAFIIQAIGPRDGELIAFNTGTGVLPAYRGQGWVDRLYAHILPHLRARGVTRCQLEVIEENERAIRVYERIGFHRERYLECYAGELAVPERPGLRLTSATLAELADFPGPPGRYAWDFSTETLARTPERYQIQKVLTGGEAGHWAGYFIFNPSNHYLMQLEALPGHWPDVLAGIRRHCASVKLNNVSAERKELIARLEQAGLENTVNQYEMELVL